MTLDERIARSIIKSQIASNAAKGKYGNISVKHSISHDPEKTGYKTKLTYAINALKLIRTNPQGMFSYYVTNEEKDQNGYPCVIIYFGFNIDRTRYQVSFHTPMRKVTPELKAMMGSGQKTHWKRTISSNQGVRALVKKFNLYEFDGRKRNY